MVRPALLALGLMVVATASPAQEPAAAHDPPRFRLDLSLPELVDALGIARIDQIAVGDSTFVSGRELCRRGEQLAVPVFARPVERPAYTPGLRLTRLETAVALSIVPARDAPEPAVDRLAHLSTILMDRPTCAALLAVFGIADDAIAAQLWLVRTIDGETTLSALVKAATAPPTPPAGDYAGRDDPVEALLASVEELADGAGGAEPERWSIRREKDEITDEPNVYITGWSSNRVHKVLGTEQIRILLRCMRNTSAVLVNHGEFDRRDRITVYTRFDDEVAREERWWPSAEGRAVGLWRGAEAIPFIRRMVEHDRLRMRLMLRDQQIDLDYDITGLRDHVETLADACNWSLR